MRSYDESKQLELISTLRQAHDEIVRLRREIEPLRAQARVLDIFERALFGPPERMGMAEDPLWRVTKALDLLVKEREEASKPREAKLQEG